MLVLLGGSLLASLIAPPVEGYYRSEAVTILDGSCGFLHLHDGVVDVVNIYGLGGPSRKRRGVYALSGKEVEWLDPLTRRVDTAIVTLAGLHFTRDLVPGLPRMNYCPRVILLPAFRRLGDIPLSATKPTGAQTRPSDEKQQTNAPASAVISPR